MVEGDLRYAAAFAATFSMLVEIMAISSVSTVSTDYFGYTVFLQATIL